MTDANGAARVYLDTNVFIRAFEGNKDETLRALFEVLHLQPKRAVTSELTLAELLAPVQDKGGKPVSVKKRFYLGLIVWSRFIDLWPVTRSIWLETADLRQYARLKLPDAVHVVTATQAQCSFFISDDKGIKLPQAIQHISPDFEGIQKVMDAIRA